MQQQLPPVLLQAIKAAHGEEQQEAHIATEAETAAAAAGSDGAAVAAEELREVAEAEDVTGGRRLSQDITHPSGLGLRKLSQQASFSGGGLGRDWRGNAKLNQCPLELENHCKRV
jgi:hypothetical protein